MSQLNEGVFAYASRENRILPTQQIGVLRKTTNNCVFLEVKTLQVAPRLLSEVVSRLFMKQSSRSFYFNLGRAAETEKNVLKVRH